MLLHCKPKRNNFYFVLLSTHLIEYSFKYNYPPNRSALHAIYFSCMINFEFHWSVLTRFVSCVHFMHFVHTAHYRVQTYLLIKITFKNSILNFCGDYNKRNDKYLLVGLECNGSKPATECKPKSLLSSYGQSYKKFPC